LKPFDRPWRWRPNAPDKNRAPERSRQALLSWRFCAPRRLPSERTPIFVLTAHPGSSRSGRRQDTNSWIAAMRQ
jgi:hypothetical protein